jgi:triacylglycerol lipase
MVFASAATQALSLLAVLVAALAGAATAGPPVIVLVHGLGGFGPNEGLFLSYWPLKSEYTDAGFDVKETAVGPVSSDWDRACELYAQLKGVRTDYGIAHSARYGHHRFGRDYTGQGLYPEWNTTFPVNLIGHSMGGTTARLLEKLLQEGDARERSAGGDTSPLFTGNKNWVISLSTYASPHDGAVLVDILGDGFKVFLQTFILAFAVLVGDTFVDDIYGVLHLPSLPFSSYLPSSKSPSSFFKHLPFSFFLPLL